MKSTFTGKFKFTGDVETLLSGIQAVMPDLGCSIANDGIPVSIECAPGPLQVLFSDGQGRIRYEQKHHFFRALGLLVQHLRNQDSSKQDFSEQDSTGKGSFNLVEYPQFSTVGPMFDVSRNAVIKVETFQFVLRKLALMGLNAAMLYMEDVYEIPDEPYFGYMRGRYTQEELKAIDDYGDQFGIEVIPSIQTLAHLEEYLKWDAARPHRDTRGVLLANTESTYNLVDRMIGAMASAFRTRRIHIGMDESEELGRGRFLDKFGHQERFDIFTGHLSRVLEIVKKHGLRPMMWSDMLLKLASSTGEDYYGGENKLPDNIINQTPKDVQMVYWDYYHTDQAHYERLMQVHKQFGNTPAFAGGIWIWGTLSVNYSFSLAATEAALRACKKEGIQDVYITLWGDDGNESNFLYALAGFQVFAEHAYSTVAPADKGHAYSTEDPADSKHVDRTPDLSNTENANPSIDPLAPTPSDSIDVEFLAERVKFITGVDYQQFLELSRLDETPGSTPNNVTWDNPSKFLLWQDILLGVFDKQIEDLELSNHYAALEQTIRETRRTHRDASESNRFGDASGTNQLGGTSESGELGALNGSCALNKLGRLGDLDFIFDVPEKLCSVLAIKSELGIQVKKAYDDRNTEALRRIAAEVLPELSAKVSTLRAAHRTQWLTTFKPFGWEVIDIRYGGLLARIDTTRQRLLDYVEGKIEHIEELEQERLVFSDNNRFTGKGLGRTGYYYRTASPNAFFHVLPIAGW